MEKVFWLVLLVIVVAAEALTVTMVSTWFALGALGALLVGLLGAELWLQALVFGVVSVVTLAMLRPMAKKHFNSRLTRTNVDSVVGKTCLVVAQIDNLQSCGQVKLGDVEWSARSSDGTAIPVGTEVKIDRVEGVKVYVTPLAVAVK